MWALGFAAFGLLAGWIARPQGGYTTPPAQRNVNTAFTTERALVCRDVAVDRSEYNGFFVFALCDQPDHAGSCRDTILWVVPLALYLISFILTFSGERGYQRSFYSSLFIFSALLTLFVMLNATVLHVYWQILAYCLLLFSACMLCHGELYLLRPSSGHLTTFYLMVSIGGALGGIFVNLIAPLIFNGYWEFFVGLAMTIAILLTILRRNRPASIFERARFVFSVFGLVTVMLAMLSTYFSGALFSARNFYGVIRVRTLVPGGLNSACIRDVSWDHRAWIAIH